MSNKKRILEEFPYGAALYYNADRPVIDVVDFEFSEIDGREYLRGWSYPHKDIYLDVTSPKEKEHGWEVSNTDGERVFMSPLTRERGQRMKTLTDED